MARITKRKAKVSTTVITLTLNDGEFALVGESLERLWSETENGSSYDKALSQLRVDLGLVEEE